MNDFLLIEHLKIKTLVGVHLHERKKKQILLTSFKLFFRKNAFVKKDFLAETIDYEAVSLKIKTMAMGSECYLIETLAEKIASVCLSFEKVEAVEIILKKPSALKNANGASFCIFRKKK